MNIASQPTSFEVFGVSVSDPIRLVIAAAFLIAVAVVFTVVGIIEAAEDRATDAALAADRDACAARRKR